MRDIAVMLLFLVLAAAAVRRPFYGAIGWVIFSVMNPHRLAFGFAYHFPFAMAIAIATMIGLLFGQAQRKPKGGAAAVVLLVLIIWSVIVNQFAINHDRAIDFLIRSLKSLTMVYVLLLLTNTRREVIILVSTLVFTLGFYGTKGGVFVLATGGGYMVHGPPDSMVADNNSLGLALTMTIPLVYFLMQQAGQRRWLRWALLGVMLLCTAAVLGSYSRGAMLAIAAMLLLLWLRGRNRILLAMLAVSLVVAAIPAMPDRWFDKMDTLRTYKDDGSAQGRLTAWRTAANIAEHRFPLAGGFQWESPETSARYSPRPEVVLVAHSIYFQMLGTTGHIGLALFLLFWFLVWRQCAALRREGRKRPEGLWALQFGSMAQVSLVSFAVGGAFLDLAMWDVPYYLFAAVAAARYALAEEYRQAPLPAVGANPRGQLSTGKGLAGA